MNKFIIVSDVNKAKEREAWLVNKFKLLDLFACI